MVKPDRAHIIYARQPAPYRRRSDTIVRVPRYSLYGDTTVATWFVNMEPISQRAAPLDWRIEPHTHPHFTQMVFVSEGAGDLSLDGDVFRFCGPCVLIIPPFRIHGLQYQGPATGSVVTIENNYLNDMLGRAPVLRTVLEDTSPLPLPAKDHASLKRCLADLEKELSSQRPGGMVGVEVQVMNMLLGLLRSKDTDTAPAQPTKTGLVSHFINLVEQKYRQQPNIDDMARTLCVSTAQLRQACKARTGLSPLEILHERIAAEAKRCLIYTNASVTEIGYSLGFDDVAYFSRFFSRTLGIAPSKFREMK